MPAQQQDSFIDDSDEFCPLCVEEFDLSDRNFKPCPCGYQICQFCFNNIRQNLNGLCPACRREYSESTIEFKQVSPEEFRADLQKQSRKKAEQKQKEAQKREQEALSRKHLSGLRVVQKNLVYVTGLNPRIREEDLLQTLRGEQYFGQYGKIIKIVVNKRSAEKSGTAFTSASQSDKASGMGVYVTFQKKSDAESCIAAVDGSQNGDRVLRATYGTTKYCSAYLRNEPCPNKGCMFLHEPGEDADSFTRQDLSSFNVQSSQRESSSAGTTRPPQQQPPVAAAAPAQATPSIIARTTSYISAGVKPPRSPAVHDEPQVAESSALPATVSWAAKGTGTPVNNKSSNDKSDKRSGTPAPADPPVNDPVSPKTSEVAVNEPTKPPKEPSVVSEPATAHAKKEESKDDRDEHDANSESVTKEQEAESITAKEPEQSTDTPSNPVTPKRSIDTELGGLLNECLQKITSSRFCFQFDRTMLSDEDYEDVMRMPPLFDRFGGIRRKENAEKERVRHADDELARRQQAAQLQLQMQQMALSSQSSHQQQQMQPALQSQQRQAPPTIFNAMGHQQPQSQASQSSRAQTPGSSVSQQFNLFHGQHPQQSQLLQQSQAHTSHHTRQSSRYNFNQDGSVKGLNAPQSLMGQQQLMQQNTQQQHPSLFSAQVFSGINPSLSSVQAPPPGLKSAPTPPALMGMYGQQGGFGFGLGSTSQQPHMGHAKTESQDLLQLMRGGSGKHLVDPSILQARLGAPQQHPMQHQLNGLVGPNQQESEDRGNELVNMLESSLDDELLGTKSAEHSPPSGTQARPAPIGTPAPAVSVPSTPCLSKASHDIHVMPVTPLLNYSVPHRAVKSPHIAPATPVLPFISRPTTPSIPFASLPATPIMPIAHLNKSSENKRQNALSHGLEVPSAPTPSKKDNSLAPSLPGTPRLPSSKTILSAVPVGSIKRDGTLSRPEIPGTSGAAQPPVTKAVEAKQSKAAPRMMRIVPSTNTTKAATPFEEKVKLPVIATNIKTQKKETTRPSTPINELVSDTASTTSSIRGLGSPALPSEPVASSSTKVKSKSALKKERLAAQKGKEKEESAIPSSSALETLSEAEHAPVVARARKKERKAAAKAAAAAALNMNQSMATTPDIERSLSPTSDIKEALAMPADPVRPPSVQIDPLDFDLSQLTASIQEGERAVRKDPYADLTAASIARELQASGEIDFYDLEMLKPAVGLSHRFEFSMDEIKDFGKRVEMAATLTAAARNNGKDGRAGDLAATPEAILARASSTFHNTRLTVTPSGVMLKGLTLEQEAKFLRLEERSAKTLPPYFGTIFPDAKGITSSSSSSSHHKFPSSEFSKERLDPLEDLSIEDPLSYLARLNKYLDVSPEDAAAAAEAASQLALMHAYHRMRPPSKTGGSGSGNNLNGPQIPDFNIKDFKAPTAQELLAMGNAAVGSVENMLMMGLQSALMATKPPTEPSMSVEQSEKMLLAARKETEAYEKKLNQLIKRNKKLIFGALEAVVGGTVAGTSS